MLSQMVVVPKFQCGYRVFVLTPAAGISAAEYPSGGVRGSLRALAGHHWARWRRGCHRTPAASAVAVLGRQFGGRNSGASAAQATTNQGSLASMSTSVNRVREPTRHIRAPLNTAA